jgi:vitamin B12 transporter
MRILYYLYALIFFYAVNTFTQEKIEYTTDELLVTAGRVPISIDNTTRNVKVFTAKDLETLPVNSVQDILQFIGGVDLKQRGVDGIQADLIIRGGTFEQSLIMIDGVKIIDPQTGHHNLNLPFSKDDIERIEVVKGQASKSFGPNAFAGVVNIITKKAAGKRLLLEFIGGQNGFYNSTLGGSYSIDNWSNRVSFNQSHSDGYRYNTGFDLTSVNYNSSLTFKQGNVNLLFGFNEKKFGANSFYTSLFPDQAEHTITKMLNLTANLESGILYISPKLYWRRNNDEFVLRQYNPSFYRNRHESNVYGAELQTTLKSKLGSTSVGLEFVRDKITSNNLGEHKRERKGLFVEHNFKSINRLNINLGGFLYKYSNTDWQIYPGADLGYELSENIKVFGSIGKAFRVPSYTDLFYNDSVTEGNPDLEYEESWTYEIGSQFKREMFSIDVSFFRREGKNIIDWVRLVDDGKWVARNIAEVNTNGIEFGLTLYPNKLNNSLPIKIVSINYTKLDSDKATESLDSRYVLDHLSNQVIANVVHELPFNIDASWVFRYEERENFEDHFITDLQLSRNIWLFDLSLKATNLFNETHRDIAEVTLPGRWITGGIKYSINFN